MTEESKAIGEVAKTTGKIVDAGRELGSFLSKFAGGPLEQGMGIVEDWLRQIRFENQVKFMGRTNDLLKQRGLSGSTRRVPLKIAIPLIEAGTLEDEESLRDLWAALLVNAADASSTVEVRRSFINILEAMTPLDASILETLYSSQIIGEDAEIWTAELPNSISITQPNPAEKRPPKPVEVALGNLARLGLIESALAWGGPSPHLCITRTPLGYEFFASIAREPIHT